MKILACGFFAGFLLATTWGCGARTGLPTPAPPPTPPSPAFCARSTYPSGFGAVSIYVLLDRSASMADDGKWDSTTAALAAFAEDPLVSGIGMGLQYFPLGDECSDSAYATPAVPIQLLPNNAHAIVTSLSAHMPQGDTPTLPALRGAIEYARGALIASPTRQVIVVLATDGDPDTCDSSAETVAEAAANGLASTPQVVTAVIGIQHADAAALSQIAAAGGDGQPIPIGSGPTAAQQFVDALRTIRDNQQTCRFTIPIPPGATVMPTDVGAVYAPDASHKTTLVRIPDAAGCAAEGGFYLDDPANPTAVILCPGTCQTAHMAGGSTLAVTAGCGAGSPPPGTPVGDAGAPNCGSAVDFDCLTSCADTTNPMAPVCVGTNWVCPSGTISTTMCQQCEPVPHGCCGTGGTIAQASCIDGLWQCPPGGVLFGQGTCQPPAACAATLPCPLTQFCKVPDFTCGKGTTAGSCQPLPSGCPGGGTQVCGCDGQVYANACSAEAAGIDVSASGSCTAPPGTFACGPLFCGIASEVCERVAYTLPFTYACLPGPPGCVPGCNGASCGVCPACPVGMKCGPSCSEDASGGRIVTCNAI